MIERDLEKKLCETLLKPTLTDNRIHKVGFWKLSHAKQFVRQMHALSYALVVMHLSALHFAFCLLLGCLFVFCFAFESTH